MQKDIKVEVARRVARLTSLELWKGARARPEGMVCMSPSRAVQREVLMVEKESLKKKEKRLPTM